MNEVKASLYLIEANYCLFVEQLIDAVKDGYRINNDNYGWVLEANGLKEITLTYDPERKYAEMPLGEVTVMDYNAQAFLDQICQVVVAGGVLDIESLAWDIAGIKRIEGKVFKIPEHTKEQLADLPWDEFKEAVKSVVGTGRDRTVMTTKYLQHTGQMV